jgi:hypothetical protein
MGVSWHGISKGLRKIVSFQGVRKFKEFAKTISKGLENQSH